MEAKNKKENVKFKFLDHTADIKFQVYGDTLNEIFENSVLALGHYLNNEEKIIPRKVKIIEVKGDDMESLFCNFLNELLFLLDSENFIAAKSSVTIRGNNIKVELSGDDSKNYSVTHVKAATYAEMYIKKTRDKLGNQKWEAQVVLDV